MIRALNLYNYLLIKPLPVINVVKVNFAIKQQTIANIVQQVITNQLIIIKIKHCKKYHHAKNA